MGSDIRGRRSRMSPSRVKNAIWLVRRSPPAASNRRSGEGGCGLRGPSSYHIAPIRSPSRFQRLDFDDRCTMIVADPQLRGIDRFVDIHAADVGLGRQEIVD